MVVRMTGAFRIISLETLAVAVGVLPLHLEQEKRAVTHWLGKGSLQTVYWILEQEQYYQR